MDRNYGAQFEFLESEPVGRALDCLGSRQAAGPFHYLINEQAKSLLALQELQHEVGALLEFRDLVIETFPSLRTKLSSTASTAHGAGPTALARTDWAPGVRVRRKLGAKKADPVPDSGFSTETSSKDTHSASSTAMTTPSAGMADETDDELWSLLDLIHRKGTRLKDEVETLQNQLQRRSSSPEEDFHRSVFGGEEIRQVRHERDSLMSRLSEMEAEVVASRIHTSRLQQDMDHLLTTKQDLEEQLRSALSQRGEVNSRIHDLHLQFVSKGGGTGASRAEKSAGNRASAIVNSITSSQKDARTNGVVDGGAAVLDRVLGLEIPKVKDPNSKKFSAILSERNPIVLQRHLLTSTVQNEILLKQLKDSSRLEVDLADKLDKAKEENEELKFQLEDRSIELEGTRARVRMLEQLQRGSPHGGPDVIPVSTLTGSSPSRSEILSNSMKNMSPIPMTPQIDHCSSTESAHDQSENNRKYNIESARRKPSKIPLKSYTAPKPPSRGKSHSSSSSQGARSRGGDSPGRPHSAQSAWAGPRSESSSSLQGVATPRAGSLPKSRNVSLVNCKDSLSVKLRGSDSLPKPGNSLGNNSTSGRSTLRKNSSSVIKWTSNSSGGKDQTSADKVDDSSVADPENCQFQWNPCSFERIEAIEYPDSLDRTDSSSRKFQTANTYTWNRPKEYYDSIDSNLFSSLYQQNGEELAECDSLEKHHVSAMSDK